MITMSEEENVYYEGMPVYVREIDKKDKKLDGAYLCITALGQYEAYINGQKVGDLYLAPGWTDYADRLLYRIYDVKDILSDDENKGDEDNLAGQKDGAGDRIAVWLGTGWWAGRNSFGTYGYNRPALIAQLTLIYEDGEKQVISTDESWKYVKDTAIRDADYFNGETYDADKPDAAMLSLSGQDGAGTGADTGFKDVYISDDFGGVYTYFGGADVRNISRRDREPLTLTVYSGVKDNGTKFGSIDPENVITYSGDVVDLKKGQTLIADLGQNMTGIPYISVQKKDEAADTRGEVTLQFAEMLNDSGDAKRGNDGPAGSLYREGYRSALTTVALLLPEDGSRVSYSPSMFYTGFRYISVTADCDVEISDIRGLFIGNESSETGFITTDNDEINRLFENVKWSQFNNFMLVATDCPQRDERLGWMGDLGSFAKASMYNADLRSFYDKWALDLKDAQTPEGAFTDTVPATVHTGAGNGGWAEAGIMIPLEVYRRYGDKGYLEDLYPAMQRYMDYLEAVSDFESAQGHIGPGDIYGDWLAKEESDSAFLSAMWYGVDAEVMSETAAIIGEKSDEKEYKKLSDRIREYLNDRYISKRNSFSVTEILFLLKYDLILEDNADPSVRKELEEMLVQKLADGNFRIPTGFAGTPLLLPVLSDMGRDDIAYSVLFCKENPSWLYQVTQGATTVWERYDSYTDEKGFADAAMNSFDHFNNGSVAGWMYEYMGGICVDHTGQIPISICPHLPDEDIIKGAGNKDGLSSVEATYGSVYGTISIRWSVSRQDSSLLDVDIVIPQGEKALVKLPIEGQSESVLEGGSYHFSGKISGS